jgi:hypothetical protein
MSSVARFFGAVLVCALFASPAHAQNPYAAEFRDQCCYLTLESGEVAGGQFFEFVNRGATWDVRNLKLGVQSPDARNSAFRHPSWSEPTRPAKLPVQAVANGQTARFAFTVQAPANVGTVTTFREHFALVAEFEHWVQNSGVYLDYTVLPSLPPSVAFTSVPPVVNRGGTLDLAVDATDNRAVHRIEFTVAGRTFTTSAPEADGRTFKLQVPGSQIPVGTHTLIARAVDRVGNFASTTATITATLADRDGDGALEDADCNDTNAAVRPGIPDRRDNGVDENCDGADALPRVDATVANAWEWTRSTTRVATLKVRGAPAGARVEVRCAGRGCPVSVRRVSGKGQTLDLRRQFFRRARLRSGATLEVRVHVDGHVAKVARFTMRRGKRPLTAFLCLPPGAAKPTRTCA